MALTIADCDLQNASRDASWGCQAHGSRGRTFPGIDSLTTIPPSFPTIVQGIATFLSSAHAHTRLNTLTAAPHLHTNSRRLLLAISNYFNFTSRPVYSVSNHGLRHCTPLLNLQISSPPPSASTVTRRRRRLHSHPHGAAQNSSDMDPMDADSPTQDGQPSPPPRRPSSNPTLGSASTPTSGAPRPPLPRPTPTAGTPAQPDTSSASTGTPNNAQEPSITAAPSSKRRRGLGVVTPNACTECRKKRAKV